MGDFWSKLTLNHPSDKKKKKNKKKVVTAKFFNYMTLLCCPLLLLHMFNIVSLVIAKDLFGLWFALFPGF
ncbi:transmembrane protein, putative [Medicago truncatula]|uniref:Transmembrane protein, putative n=1 Tax=Medicago truncatula TaxID=3880 RepID=A0A072VI92_MEDTR|nr:transmembrane protein, putative [Medicago truncatula]